MINGVISFLYKDERLLVVFCKYYCNCKFGKVNEFLDKV